MVLISLAASVCIKENPGKARIVPPANTIVIIWTTILFILILTKIFSDSAEEKKGGSKYPKKTIFKI